MAPNLDAHQLHFAVVGGDPAVRQSLISHSTTIHQQANHETHIDNSYDHLHLVDISELNADNSEQNEPDASGVVAELTNAGKVFHGTIVILSAPGDELGRISANDIDRIQQIRSANKDGYTVLVNPSPSEATSQELEHHDGIPIFRYHETRASAMPIFAHIISHIRRVDIQSALDAKTERTVVGDNDSAKAGLESTDDMPNTTKLDLEVIYTRERHMRRLAEMCKQIEHTARDHYTEIESVFRGEIDSLEKTINVFRGEIGSLEQTIKGGVEERHNLVHLLHQKDVEIDGLRGEIINGNESHKHQLEEHSRHAQNQRSHAEEQHKQERDEALASLRVEMTAESEKRVSDLLEETGREAEERVSKVRAEMSQMQADFDKERERTMKEMKSEMARLADREREARERSKRAELAQRGDEYRQPMQTWAIARLWGVGQARAR